MDAQTLSRAMGGSLPLARYQQLLPAFNSFLLQAGCTTVNRAAMACAQTGHESVGLKYREEIASGKAYEGRRDLGNTQPGDGSKFKGHGWLQVTGRGNHTAVSRWAHSKNYVPTPTYFVDHPAELAADRFVWIGPTWYWTVARPTLNRHADAGALETCTRLINGGLNGLADRRARWERCRALGTALLPTGTAPHTEEDDDMTPEQARQLNELYRQLVAGTGADNKPQEWGWDGWQGGTGERLTLIDMNRRANVELRQARNAIAALQATVNQLLRK